MDPLSRHTALLCALLCAALPAAAHGPTAAQAGGAGSASLGRCQGADGAPRFAPGGPAASLRELMSALRLTEDDGRVLAARGYRLDEAGDRLLAPGGSPVSAAQLAFWRRPVDAAVRRISAPAWMELQMRGYRLVEASCRLVHPENGAADNYLVDMTEDDYARHQTLTALETLNAGLSGLPPGAPVPPALLAQLRMMDGAGVRLPPALQQRLFADPPPAAGALSGLLRGELESALAFFDGSASPSELAVSAAPLGRLGGPARPVNASSHEAAIGALLGRELETVFARTAPGRELLARFNGRLPPMLVVKLAQRGTEGFAMALYNNEAREVMLNHWALADLMTTQYPGAKGQDLSSPAALLAFLRRDPAAARFAAENTDYVILHEFEHHRQGETSPVFAEMSRGNIPATDPLSLEKDAFRAECRYFLARVAADPGLLARGYAPQNQEICPGVLSDPNRLDEFVADFYLRGVPGVRDLPEMSRVQALRRQRATERLKQLALSMDLPGLARAGLQMLGLDRGAEALGAEAARDEAARARFPRQLDPLRPALDRVPATLVREGRYVEGLSFLERAGSGISDGPAREALEAGLAYYAGRPDIPLERRVIAETGTARMAQARGMSFTPAFAEAYVADLRAWSVELRARARRAPAAEQAYYAEQIKLADEIGAVWRNALPKSGATR